ncbi:ABC transporter substrate-binding protein [Streptomyces spongiae]|uniref:ABC transporter substrate-binding protein n=1 Tax=Streptomyces spongiae TaxID=565072 RepID=A0A5N8XBN2_9ACTN|nr:ABC transporter substrate-binding protein [Streptomyces spongiae]MPY56546.1 ABC transporter substrate-binding protein [Streptomyces spongiae]
MVRVRTKLLGVAVVAAVGAAACGSPPPTKGQHQTATLSATTAVPVGDTGPLTWGLYRATSSLDPLTAIDIPESSVIDSLCESLLLQKPDFALAPGLAESAEYTDPRTLVLKLRPDVRFWDGTLLTPADVVFSLQRARDPKAGGYYSTVFERVASIKATGPHEVELKLSEPDYWLRGELSTMAGTIVQKNDTERKGKKFGTPSGGVMCTGPFRLKSWKAGGETVIERNSTYWNPDQRAKTPRITFKPVESSSAQTAALRTGDLDGYYSPTLSSYEQLKKNARLTVATGPALATDALAITNLQGPLGDVRVRRALSLAIDRSAYSQAVYHDQVATPRTSTNPGTWAYGTSVFAETSGKASPLDRDLDQAKKLVRQAGAEGRTLVMAVVPALSSINTLSTVVSEAARALGLKIEFKTFSPDVFGTLFVDPKAREGIDLLPTLNGPYHGDPAPYLATYTLPGGGQNFSGWQDAKVTRLLTAARETAGDDNRAKLVAEADQLITKELPWIPIAHPYSVVYMSKKITGAPASSVFGNGPWANMIGAARK